MSYYNNNDYNYNYPNNDNNNHNDNLPGKMHLFIHQNSIDISTLSDDKKSEVTHLTFGNTFNTATLQHMDNFIKTLKQFPNLISLNMSGIGLIAFIICSIFNSRDIFSISFNFIFCI